MSRNFRLAHQYYAAANRLKTIANKFEKAGWRERTEAYESYIESLQSKKQAEDDDERTIGSFMLEVQAEACST